MILCIRYCSSNHATFFVVISDEFLVCVCADLRVPQVNFVALAHRHAGPARQELVINVCWGDFEGLVKLALRPLDLRAHLALTDLQLVDLSDILIHVD